MQRVDIVKTESGEWTALYVDGVLVHENHRIRLEEGLEYLDIELHTHEISDSSAEEGIPSKFSSYKEGVLL